MRRVGELSLVVPEKPTRVAMNEYHEALVILDR
jgi:hypothetical protein